MQLEVDCDAPGPGEVWEVLGGEEVLYEDQTCPPEFLAFSGDEVRDYHL